MVEISQLQEVFSEKVLHQVRKNTFRKVIIIKNPSFDTARKPCSFVVVSTIVLHCVSLKCDRNQCLIPQQLQYIFHAEMLLK